MSVPQLIKQAADKSSSIADFDHPFMQSIRNYCQTGDEENLKKEKIVLKLLRLTPDAQEGFVMTDYPKDLGTAELMEEYKGGLNAFVHLTLPDSVLLDIEESKFNCMDCGRNYYS